MGIIPNNRVPLYILEIQVGLMLDRCVISLVPVLLWYPVVAGDGFEIRFTTRHQLKLNKTMIAVAE